MEELINKLTEEFKRRLPNDEEQLVQAFKNMLSKKWSYIKEHPSEVIKDREEFERAYIKYSAQKIFELSDIDSVKRELIEDEYLEQIKIISIRSIFYAAYKKLHGEEVEIDVDEEITKIDNLLTQVQSYNIKEARRLVSEAQLDAEYIKNPHTEIYSFRLGEIINGIRFQKGER